MKPRYHTLENVKKLIADKAPGYKFMAKHFVSYYGFINWLRRHKNITMNQAKINGIDDLVAEYDTFVIDKQFAPTFEELYGVPKSSFTTYLMSHHGLRWKDIKDNPKNYIAMYKKKRRR